MAKKIFISKNAVAFAIAVLASFALRLYLGRLFGIYFMAREIYDDAMLLFFADFESYFINQNLYNVPYAHYMVKDIGFPVLLHIFSAVGISYVDGVSLCWFAAAATTTVFFKCLSGTTRKSLLFAVFAFVLFNPAAFDAEIGTRLNRNSVLFPFYLTSLSMFVVTLLWHIKNASLPNSRLFLWQTALGTVFVLTYFLKEDGIWLAAILAATTAACLFLLYRRRENFSRRSLVVKFLALAMPFIMLGTTQEIYKEINFRYFGVREVNTRLNGQIGEFASITYHLAGKHMAVRNWVPTDGLLHAFDESPTLRANAPLREKVMTHYLCHGDIMTHPIHADTMTWIILEALKESGTCHNLIEQENYMRQVNTELYAAIREGRLPTESKLRISSAAGGRTLDEALQLLPVIPYVYKIYLSHDIYRPGAMHDKILEGLFVENLQKVEGGENLPQVKFASAITHINLSEPNLHTAKANKIAAAMFFVYSIAYKIGLVATVAACLRTAFLLLFRRSRSPQLKNRKKINFSAPSGGNEAPGNSDKQEPKFIDGQPLIVPFVACICFVALSFAYICSLGWFFGFADDLDISSSFYLWACKYYFVGVPALLTLTILSGAHLAKQILFWQDKAEICRTHS